MKSNKTKTRGHKIKIVLGVLLALQLVRYMIYGPLVSLSTAKGLQHSG